MSSAASGICSASRPSPSTVFRRQVPFDRYVADFAAHSPRLIIEIDGSQHGADDPAEREPTSYLEGRGYRVLRFWNRDVLSNTEGVGELILRAVGGAAQDAG